MTGGGPPTEVTFKPWELTILGTLSPVSIYGIEGEADTGKERRTVRDVCDPSGDSSVPPGLIVKGMEDLLEFKRKRLEIEDRKVHAFEIIATVLERQQSEQMIHHLPSFSVSPIIKFH